MTESRSHPAVFAGLLGSVAWGVPKLAYASPLEEVGNAVMHSLVLQFLVGCAAGALVASVVAGISSLVEQRRVRDGEPELPEVKRGAPRAAAAQAEPEPEPAPEADLESANEPAAPKLIPLPETFAEVLPEDRWSESSLSLVRAQFLAEEEDPTGNLGRMRTGKIVIELEDRLAADAATREHAQNLREAKTAGRARHFAAAKPSAAPATTRRSGRHFTPAAKPDAMAGIADAVEILKATPQPAARGRHFSGSAVVVPSASVARSVPEVVSAPVVEVAAQASEGAAALQSVSAPQTSSLSDRRTRLASLPTIESRRRSQQAAAAVARIPEVTAAPAAQPAAAVAQQVAPASVAVASVQAQEPDDGRLSMTDKLTLRQRLAMRTKNVREVLAERLSPDAMESIPHLERADGTKAEITPSWFDQTLAPALASITGITGKLSDTTPRTSGSFEPLQPASVPTVLAPAASAPVVPTPAPAAAVVQPAAVVSAAPAQPAASIDRDARAAYISKRVAEVNLGMFPERRGADDLDHEDAWEVALAAMGENIRQQTPVFQDVVGGPSTIDDPDGLEGPTGFIPFRVPAGRPDVVDTESYIDYLIDDELSQNESPALQRSRHSYLRVIEGGTSPIRLRRRAEDTGHVSRGRHFAPPRYAAEA